MLFVSDAFGLQPGKHLSQYGHTAWRVQDGFFSGAPTSITQTRDGYIWIGTQSGLVRFDGVRFVPLAVSEGEPLRNTSIASLFSDGDGSLWIGTGSDLEHWQNGRLTHFPEHRGFYFGVITKILRSRDGVLWFARRRVHDASGPICSLQGNSARCYNSQDGVEPWVVLGMLEDKDGSFWIHSDLSLFHWDPRRHRSLSERLINVGEAAGLQQITFDRNGDVLMAMAQSGDRTGIGRVRNGRMEPLETGTFDGQQTSALAIFLDSQGSLWIGTDSKGLYRVTGTEVDHYAAEDGLSDDTVNGFFEDREGNIWVTTNQGVDRFRNILASTYSVREGLSNSSVGAVLATSDGTVWISNFRALDALHPDGTVTSFHGGRGFPGQPTGALTDAIVRSLPASKWFPGQSVGSLMEDRKNRLWLGIDSGLQIFDGRTFTRLQKPGPRLTGAIAAMVEDRESGVWAISVSPNPHGTLLHFVDDSLKEEIPYDSLHYDRGRALAADPHEGIWVYLTDDRVAHWARGRAQSVDLHRAGPNSPSLTALVAGPDGFVIGSSPMGLSVIRDGNARTLSIEQGLPCANIYTVTDTDEALWLYSQCGAVKLSHRELERWWNDPSIRPRIEVLDVLDGIRPAATPATLITPGASHTRNGRVWFANASVLQMIDARETTPPVPLLPVQIEQLVADGKTYSTSQQVLLPPLTKDVQVDYTSPSFATPQRLHFRYRLEGLDDRWVDSGTRRQAFFTNLRPGFYVFHVSASARDLPWTAESTLRFRIAPKFYQTVWFTLLCVTCSLLALLMTIRLRIEAVKRDLRARLQVRMDERERIARDLHDNLFQDIQGVLLRIDNSTNTLAEEHPARSDLKDALRLSDQVMADSRERVLELRAENMDRGSIGPALSQVGGDLGKVYAPAPAFQVVELGAAERLHPIVFEEVFHICREALFNAFRHSGARHIEVEILFARDTFSVRITDDGTGIDERVLSDGGRPGHFGLKGMIERARKIGARLTIRSRPGAGTEVELSIPKSVACNSRSTGWLRGLLWRRQRSG